MKFMSSQGLWLLLSIPILILVFLLKTKHRAYQVSNTYLWRLSESYRKKRAHSDRVRKLFLLFAQCAIVALCALAAAQPRIPALNQTERYIVVIDTSASMRIIDQAGESRFDRAKQMIKSHAEENRRAGMALITTTVNDPLVLPMNDSHSDITRTLESLECGWGVASAQSALEAVQTVYRVYPQSKICFYTDGEYASTDNIDIINIAEQDAWNIRISGVTGYRAGDGAVFENTVTSFSRDCSVSVALYINNAVRQIKTVECKRGIPASVTWRVENAQGYITAAVKAQVEDSLLEDNESACYIAPAKELSCLLIGDGTFYIKSALNVFDNVTTNEIPSPDAIKLEGYNLYVFSNCVPKTLPSDGQIWFINPPVSQTGDLCGLAVLGAEAAGRYIIKAQGDFTKYVDRVANGLVLKDTVIQRFTDIIDAGVLSPVLMCGDRPVLLVGESPAQIRYALFAFDLKRSNLPMQADFITLTSNLLDYCNPAIIDADEFTFQAAIELRVPNDCKRISLIDAKDGVWDVPFDGKSASVTVEKPGEYTVIQEKHNSDTEFQSFYVEIPSAESDCDSRTSSGISLSLQNPEHGPVKPTEPDVSLTPFIAFMLLLFLTLECVMYGR